MKKIVMGIVLALTMVLVTGCGSKKEETKGKVLLVGTNAEYKPFEYLEKGSIVGFDIELTEKILTKLGYTVKWKNMSFDGLMPALQSGKIDMIVAGMTPTPERAKNVDFTQLYYNSEQTIITKKEDNSIKTKEDLVGKKVGVQLGAVQDTLATSIKGVEVKRYNSFAGAILALNAGKVDAVILEDVIAGHFVDENKDLKISTVIPNEKEEGFAMGLPKNSSELVEKLNKEISEFKKSGEYKKLVDKYLVK